MKIGDHVKHNPSGETWVICAIKPDRNELRPCGWPPTYAKITDCDLVESVSQEVSDKIKEEFSKGKKLTPLYSRRARLLYGWIEREDMTKDMPDTIWIRRTHNDGKHFACTLEDDHFDRTKYIRIDIHKAIQEENYKHIEELARESAEKDDVIISLYNALITIRECVGAIEAHDIIKDAIFQNAGYIQQVKAYKGSQ